MFDDLENLFGEPVGRLDFSYEPPEVPGVYICVEYDRYQEFLEDDNAFRLDGLKEVFVKQVPGEGKLYAAGDELHLSEEEFDDYVWAFKADFS